MPSLFFFFSIGLLAHYINTRYWYDVQVLCHVVPSLVKLRKEGLDGHEKIKSYMYVHLSMWSVSLFLAINYFINLISDTWFWNHSTYFRWWMSFGFAILEALILACYSLPYSIYAASQRLVRRIYFKQNFYHIMKNWYIKVFNAHKLISYITFKYIICHILLFLSNFFK